MKSHYLVLTAALALGSGCSSVEEEQRVNELEQKYGALAQKVSALEAAVERSKTGIAAIASTLTPTHPYLQGRK